MINFTTESSAFQNRLLNSSHSISDIKRPCFYGFYNGIYRVLPSPGNQGNQGKSWDFKCSQGKSEKFSNFHEKSVKSQEILLIHVMKKKNHLLRSIFLYKKLNVQIIVQNICNLISQEECNNHKTKKKKKTVISVA